MTQVPTPASTPAQLPQMDLEQIGKLLDTLTSLLPIISTFVPQARLAAPFIPIAKEILEFIQELQTGKHDLPTVIGLVSGHLKDIAGQMEGVKAALAKPV